MARGGKNDQIDIEDRRAKALELRKGGSSYRAIAKKLNTDVATAYKDVDVALKSLVQMNTASASELREIELERLDAMLLSISDNLKNGHLGAIDRALRIMERRARLLGLDMPTKIETIDWRSQTIAEIREGKYTHDEIAALFGDAALADDLFLQAGKTVTAVTVGRDFEAK
jgi:hypothetical protein